MDLVGRADEGDHGEDAEAAAHHHLPGPRVVRIAAVTPATASVTRAFRHHSLRRSAEL